MEDHDEIEYKVDVKYIHRYFEGDNSYKSDSNYREPETLTAYSLSELYEAMAREHVRFMLDAEKECKQNAYHYKMEDFRIEFSAIYTEVEPYFEEKMKATKTYLEKGAARDKFWADERARQEAEKTRQEAYAKKEREARDLAEYERLSKKYNK